MESVWMQHPLPAFPELSGDLRTDVLVIGGGMAGILTAYYLTQSGVDCVLVEKGRICSGNTGRTTAKITAQHGLIYHKIAKERGLEPAQQYYAIHQQAVEEYARLCATLDCDFQTKDHFVYARSSREKLESEMDVLGKIGAEAFLFDTVPVPVSVAGAICFPNQAQFHPLKFIGGIVGNLHIYENTFVRELVGTEVITNRGRIHADRVVCCTHFPLLNKHGFYFLKLYQHRSYVLALQGAQNVNGMYLDEQEGVLSFRNQGDLLLLGGGGARTGRDCGNWEQLRSFAREKYPGAVQKYAWAAQDCMSLDGIPYIGPYSRSTKNLFVATGFNKWGMTGSMAAAWVIRDFVLGRKNEYRNLFAPSRSILRRQLWTNSVEAVKNLLSSSEKTCPHLGCALKWNEAEHSWDCPCHGSRFSEDGKLLDNPANGDL